MISVVVTTLNEEKSIERLLKSLFHQTKKAEEVILVDGGSTDNTIRKTENAKRKTKIPVGIYIKQGNRSVGRNYGISQANGMFP